MREGGGGRQVELEREKEVESVGNMLGGSEGRRVSKCE